MPASSFLPTELLWISKDVAYRKTQAVMASVLFWVHPVIHPQTTEQWAGGLY